MSGDTAESANVAIGCASWGALGDSAQEAARKLTAQIKRICLDSMGRTVTQGHWFAKDLKRCHERTQPKSADGDHLKHHLYFRTYAAVQSGALGET